VPGFAGGACLVDAEDRASAVALPTGGLRVGRDELAVGVEHDTGSDPCRCCGALEQADTPAAAALGVGDAALVGDDFPLKPSALDWTGPG
jgi:hypothetical protein